jgi:hypothetical protein
MVVAPMMHRIPLLPDHALTAASTASFCQSSGPISPNLMVATLYTISAGASLQASPLISTCSVAW